MRLSGALSKATASGGGRLLFEQPLGDVDNPFPVENEVQEKGDDNQKARPFMHGNPRRLRCKHKHHADEKDQIDPYANLGAAAPFWFGCLSYCVHITVV